MLITEYMTKMKSLFDALAFAGCKLSAEDQIMYYLGGLGQEYEPVIVSVTFMNSQVRGKDPRSFVC